MFKEEFIAKVSDSTIESSHFTTKSWERSFNIACWLRFRTPKPNSIELLLHYQDDEGRKEAVVDSCSTELDTSVLLSANIILAGKGKVTDMGVYLRVKDKNCPYVVDELYVQSCYKDAGSEPKLISEQF